jgi:RNA polymerase sigma factor (sigma-70 family)
MNPRLTFIVPNQKKLCRILASGDDMLLNMSEPDLDLLQRFARDHAQDAFTTLVQRHVNLVYSAALRQVRSPQLAEEVAQSVFTDLARVAATPSSPLSGRDAASQTSLTPWLYAVTRRTAIDVVRKESRRQLREQIAVEMNAMNATEASWTDIEPLLDEAVAALDETDRAAVLLRYFENQSLRAVGQQLGVSDDAAQKRVSRAVERLREFFTKRGVSVGAGGLVVVISANAVQTAPVGLAVTISAAALAGTAVTTSTIVAATKTIAMTTLQKTLVTATVAILAGAGIYEARQAAQLRDQVQTLQQQQTPLAEQIQQLQNSFADATNRLADLLAENSRLQKLQNQNELLKLRGQVGVLQSQNNAANQILDATKRVGFSPAEVREWSPTNFPLNLPKEGMVYMGYSQPEAALETLLWAFRAGNQQVIMNTLSPEQSYENWGKLMSAEATDQLAKRGSSFMENISWVDMTKKEIVSDNQVLFTMHIVPNSGSANGIICKVLVKKAGDKWLVEDLAKE